MNAYAVLWIPYIVALALLVAEMRGRLRDATIPTPRRRPELWIIAIVTTYLVQLAIVRYGATHALAIPQWRLMMPLPTVMLYSVHSDAIEAVLLTCGALQSYALLVLFRSSPAPAAVAAGAAALAIASLLAPALTSADAYSNVAYALMGMQAYAPPIAHPSPDLSPIYAWWGNPIVPAPYGPLWLIVDRLITMPFPALVAKIEALRVFGCAGWFALIGLLHAYGLPRRFLVATALNPVFAMQFVANAHNDVLALIAIVAAAALARRRAPVAAVLLVVAGLIKLPYVVLGLPALAEVRPRWKRALGAGVAIAAVAAFSWWSGGEAYLASLVSHAAQAGPLRSNVPWHLAAMAVALALIAGALWGARRYRAAVWLLPPIGGFFPAFVYPWYLVWGLPYALARHRVMAYLLIWLPFVAALIDQLAIRLWTILFVFPCVLLLSLRLDRRFSVATE